MPRYTYTFDLRDPRGFGVTLDVSADSEDEAMEKLLHNAGDYVVRIGPDMSAVLHLHDELWKHATVVSIYDMEKLESVL